MAETTRRPLVAIKIEWDPNTGALQVVSANSGKMEVVGILQYAISALIAEDQKRTIVPAGPLMPHLRNQ